MASGDAVAPTAIDRPQCFIEKERVSFPCRALARFVESFVSVATTYMRPQRVVVFFIICIYIYIFIHIMRRCLLTLLVRGVVYIVSLLPIGCWCISTTIFFCL